MKHCNKCEVPLVLGDNWTAGRARKPYYICSNCANAATAAYRKANPEKIKAWRKANREKIKAWRKANREKLLAQSAEYYKSNREKLKAYRKANPEEFRARDKAYCKANPGKVNAKNAKRRALQKQQTPSWYCHATVTEIYETAAEFGYHVDHIVPLSKGGLHSHENLQLLTAEENLYKSDSDCWIQ